MYHPTSVIYLLQAPETRSLRETGFLAIIHQYKLHKQPRRISRYSHNRFLIIDRSAIERMPLVGPHAAQFHDDHISDPTEGMKRTGVSISLPSSKSISSHIHIPITIYCQGIGVGLPGRPPEPSALPQSPGRRHHAAPPEASAAPVAPRPRRTRRRRCGRAGRTASSVTESRISRPRTRSTSAITSG